MNLGGVGEETEKGVEVERGTGRGDSAPKIEWAILSLRWLIPSLKGDRINWTRKTNNLGGEMGIQEGAGGVGGEIKGEGARIASGREMPRMVTSTTRGRIATTRSQIATTRNRGRAVSPRIGRIASRASNDGCRKQRRNGSSARGSIAPGAGNTAKARKGSTGTSIMTTAMTTTGKAIIKVTTIQINTTTTPKETSSNMVRLTRPTRSPPARVGASKQREWRKTVVTMTIWCTCSRRVESLIIFKKETPGPHRPRILIKIVVKVLGKINPPLHCKIVARNNSRRMIEGPREISRVSKAKFRVTGNLSKGRKNKSPKITRKRSRVLASKNNNSSRIPIVRKKRVPEIRENHLSSRSRTKFKVKTYMICLLLNELLDFYKRV